MTSVKVCSCGASFTREEWNALPLVATTFLDEPIEIRNCPVCDSSLARERSRHSVNVPCAAPSAPSGWEGST